MNLFKSLFGGSKQNETPKLKTSKQQETLAPLFDMIKGIGQSEKPLLRKGYGTVMPCYDFSTWLIEKYIHGDYRAIWDFKSEYKDDNYSESGGVSVDLEELFPQYFGPDILVKKFGLSRVEAKKQWDKINEESNKKLVEQSQIEQKERFDDFFKENYSKYLVIEDRATIELWAFFVLSAKNEFNAFKDGSDLAIAKILCPYNFSIDKEAFRQLIDKANQFLREMRRQDKEFGGDYWKNTSNFRISDLRQEYTISLQTDLAEKLKRLGLGERLHFFDFANSMTFGKYWSGNSTFSTRTFGIYEKESISKMVELELFIYTSEIESIPDVVSKGELKDKAEVNGFELKKSWTKDKIYNYLLSADGGVDFLKRLIDENKPLVFNQKYIDDLNKILEYQVNIKIVANLLYWA
jgi:hypothetical protein